MKATGARLRYGGARSIAVRADREHALLDLDDQLPSVRRLGHAEGAAIETLIKETQAGVVGERSFTASRLRPKKR